VTEQILKKIGMNVDLQAMDWATVVARRAKQDPPDQGGWHIFHTFWVGADLLNPINNAGMNARGRNGGFFGWAEDAEIERLKAEFLKEPDAAKRKALAEAITKRAFEVVMYVPLGQMQFPAAYRKSLTGVLDGPVPVFWNVEKTAK
jgi:peptide/nickel transport system substrate-binding protein